MTYKSPQVQIGKILLGGKNPVCIQTMTNTDTADAKATADQCIELAKSGAEMVRITVNNEASAMAVREIKGILIKKGFGDLPIIGDFHFNGHKLLSEYPEMAKILDKYRINPGNVCYGENTDENFEKIIGIAIENQKPVRIGGNSGSLDKNILKELSSKYSGKELKLNTIIESVIRSAKKAEEIGLKQNQIVLSVKLSSVTSTIKAYEILVEKTKDHPYALHLGLTEAGSGMQGLISSTTALSILLHKGIGDTIRISITPAPGEARTKEVIACKHLLQALELRFFRPHLTSCPGCGRTDNTFFQKLTKEINEYVEENFPKWEKTNSHIRNLKIAIMGCIVNGPGEAGGADIALNLPGKSEEKIATVYLKGKYFKTLNGQNIKKEFLEILENFIIKTSKLD